MLHYQIKAATVSRDSFCRAIVVIYIVVISLIQIIRMCHILSQACDKIIVIDKMTQAVTSDDANLKVALLGSMLAS